MKLTYRGVSYEYNPPTVEVSESNTVGKYRGLDVRFRNPQKAMVLASNLDMKYRGAAYPTSAPATAPTEATAPVAPAASAPAPALSISDRARSLLMGRHRTIKQRQQGMLTRLAVEVGMPTDEASHYWNHIQGKVHPSFRVDYDRSSVSLS
jgi:Domain of unknown function (DUF4278)